MHPEIKITALLDAIQETIIFVTVKKIELKSLNFSFFYQPFLFINTLELKTLIDDQFIS
jgi:hypothetical protein